MRGGVVDVARRIIVEHSVIEINRITSSLIERLSSIAENDRSKSNSPTIGQSNVNTIKRSISDLLI